jgi:hypothetical protein
MAWRFSKHFGIKTFTVTHYFCTMHRSSVSISVVIPSLSHLSCSSSLPLFYCVQIWSLLYHPVATDTSHQPYDQYTAAPQVADTQPCVEELHHGVHWGDLKTTTTGAVSWSIEVLMIRDSYVVASDNRTARSHRQWVIDSKMMFNIHYTDASLLLEVMKNKKTKIVYTVYSHNPSPLGPAVCCVATKEL